MQPDVSSANASSGETAWQRPPVVEVVLGVQFDPLPGLTNGYLGWFWGEQHRQYPSADDVPFVDQVVEAGDRGQDLFVPTFMLRPAAGNARLRMVSADRTRMIQIQNGWLVANWMKGDGVYPGYSGVRHQFDEALARFASFLRQRGLGSISPNLWEVTYIDHIARGTVWQDVADLTNVLPGLLGRTDSPRAAYDAVRGTWTFPLALKHGRLRVEIHMAQRQIDPREELLIVTSTARGPISEQEPDLGACLNAGHTAAVETFRAITSERAQAYWKGHSQ